MSGEISALQVFADYVFELFRTLAELHEILVTSF